MTRRKRNRAPRLVAVHWLDAAGSRDEDDVEPIDALTCGFVVEEGKREDGEEYLKIAGEIFTDGGYRDVTAVPIGMVRQIIFKPIVLPAAFEGWRAKSGK